MENNMLLIPIYFCFDIVKNSSSKEEKEVRPWSDNFFFFSYSHYAIIANIYLMIQLNYK